MIDWRPFDRLPTVGEQPRRSLLDRIETALDRSWTTRWGGVLLCGLAIALITIGLLGVAGVF